jgi:RNA polymerase sigma-70 factor (ECF subfamily)
MDAETFERLCAKHRPAVLAYAYTCSRRLDVAEDIAQETLLIAFRKRDQYFPEADFKSWLISIARNLWFRERERLQMGERTSRYIEENAQLIFGGDEYDEKRWEQECGALSGCLEKLQKVDREIIQAHFTQDLTYDQIAQDMNQSLSWVKVRMFRARATLLQCVRGALLRAGRERT